jgi:hypothetical protein
MASSAQAVSVAPVPRRAAWIESPAFDLAFLLLAPLVALPVIGASLLGITTATLVAFALAFAHYLSSFSFFFWDENQPRHRARWAAFYLGPLTIVAVFWGLVLLRVPLVIPFVLFFWNTYHVALQSCGIASLYRHRSGVGDPRQKPIVNAAILCTALALALANIETHDEVRPVLLAVWGLLPVALKAASAGVAAFAVARLVLALRDRARRGEGAGGPELAALVTAVAMFHPYLWARSSEAATFAMLIPHYIQYLGLVWLLHRRKFKERSGSRPQLALQRLAASTPLLVAVLAACGLGFLGAKHVFARLGQQASFEALYLLLAFVHFYLDGLFWAFRDPHVRRTIGPYLTGAPAAAGGR